ncbi:pyruvate formate-lyase-activating protein [Clostridium tyrobutyricum]|uniref:pyruvate formate-lyase-activating protein n=1 Tax=Clostridium tyrobutyricum TaxID=1519 RepID=UPI00073D8EC8|nr:pyruvate formate-lyase-activating protein [Clostridium tyrobutyricum]
MGRIHSIETMGLVDGPGIRVVVFFQGCRLRCAFCHNPDTWKLDAGEDISAEQLLEKVERYRVYFEKSGGGVTCSGGDPLMQPEFLIEFLKLCRENGINTIVDTSGFGKGNYKEILKYTDLVMLDIKHIDDAGYKELTGGNIQKFYDFLKEVNNSNAKLWIRHVMVPGVTDNYECMDKIVHIIENSVKSNKLEKFEILPYHTMGVNKYEKLGVEYRLKGVKPMDKKRALEFQKYVVEKINKNKSITI